VLLGYRSFDDNAKSFKSGELLCLIKGVSESVCSAKCKPAKKLRNYLVPQSLNLFYAEMVLSCKKI
jgi:hypothetical protein